MAGLLNDGLPAAALLVLEALALLVLDVDAITIGLLNTGRPADLMFNDDDEEVDEAARDTEDPLGAPV